MAKKKKQRAQPATPAAEETSGKKIEFTPGAWRFYTAQSDAVKTAFNAALSKLETDGRLAPPQGKPIAPKVDVKAGPTGWHQELAYFVDCVAKGKKPNKYQTLGSVEATMKLVFAEEKSVKSGKAVKL